MGGAVLGSRGAPASGSACRALVHCLPFSPGGLSPGSKFSEPVGSTRRPRQSRCPHVWLAGWLLPPHSQLWAPLGLTGVPARGAQCRVPSYTRGQAVPPALGLGVSAQAPSSAPPGLLPPGATSRPRPLPSVLHGLSLVPTGSRRPLLSVCLAPVPPGSPCSVQLRRSPPPPWPRPVSAFVRAAPPPGTLTCPCGCHSEAPGQGAYRGGGLEAG